jgi:outer membrane protein TolC
VLQPERDIHYLSLAEAFAIALENGTIGNRFLNGTTDDELTVTFTGGSVTIPQGSIRVLALDPAIIATEMEASLSKFDVRWNTSMTWNTTDRPVATALETAIAQGRTAIEAENAAFRTSLLKPLPTGGVAGITFETDYELSNLPARLNPAYRPILQFQFEQPLLQGFGVEINQLRATHPGSVLTPFFTGTRAPGILITRVRFDEQRAEFERVVDVMLTNVEIAYWNLYGAYGMLFSQEQALKQAFGLYSVNKQRFDVNRTTIQDLMQSRAQYEMFRARRIETLGLVIRAEHELRGLMGLPVEDGTRLVPVDAPTLSPYQPDWASASDEAMVHRPELALARSNVKLRQLEVINERNLLLPDLRFFSTYDINGIGTHLDGGSDDQSNALHSLATDKFNDWSVGLRMDVPLGFRDAHAGVRRARLLLAQAYALLKDQERRVQRYTALQYRLIFEYYEQIQAERSQRIARATELQGRLRDFLEGRGTLDLVLQAQRFWAEALRAEYMAIRDYNNALAKFEYAKGTILERDNVEISEGPLPFCAQVRAVEHERQRTAALVLRERAEPVHCPVCQYQDQAINGLPQLPENVALPIPSILEPNSVLPQDQGIESGRSAEGQPVLSPQTAPPGASENLPMPGPATAPAEPPADHSAAPAKTPAATEPAPVKELPASVPLPQLPQGEPDSSSRQFDDGASKMSLTPAPAMPATAVDRRSPQPMRGATSTTNSTRPASWQAPPVSQPAPIKLESLQPAWQLQRLPVITTTPVELQRLPVIITTPVPLPVWRKFVSSDESAKSAQAVGQQPGAAEQSATKQLPAIIQGSPVQLRRLPVLPVIITTPVQPPVWRKFVSSDESAKSAPAVRQQPGASEQAATKQLPAIIQGSPVQPIWRTTLSVPQVVHIPETKSNGASVGTDASKPEAAAATKADDASTPPAGAGQAETDATSGETKPKSSWRRNRVKPAVQIGG